MNYYCLTMFLTAPVSAAMYGAEARNPYFDTKNLCQMLANTAKQEATRKDTAKSQIAQILARAKATQEQKKIDKLLDSFNSFYHLPRRSGEQQSNCSTTKLK